MLHLTLAGLSADNKRLLLVSDSGQEFSLVIDGKLRAALRGEHARLGQLEIHMESTLRPRDIQARIRAGESTESVAQAASTTVDKIMPFANPVLAERAHVAQRAQRSSVRRKAGDQGARTLGDAVEAQLQPLNVSADVIEWDAWRREDGRWTLTAEFVTSKRKGTATFTFDQPGNYVTTDNDDARWLVGDEVRKPARAAERESNGRDDLEQARQRRLASVPEDQLPLGEDAIELANDRVDDPDAVTDDLTDTVAAIRADEAAEEPALSPTPEPLTDEPSSDEPSTGGAADDVTASSEPPAVQAQEDETVIEEPPARPQPKRPAKKKGRASVPSWDEIMFGGGKQD